MKNTIITLFALAILTTLSCKDTGIHSPLVGKWRVAGYSISSGGPLVYTPVNGGSSQYVQFYENGTFRSNFYQDYGT